MAKEPLPPDPAPVRYSARPFPPYRFAPGLSPHPRRHPQGHAYGQPEVPPPRYEPERWKENAEYLFGVDLYNYRYWWECHECLEGLWHLTGHVGREALYLQGVIQVAAANLQRFIDHRDGARRLATEAVEKLVKVGAKEFMGLKLGPFIRQIYDYHLDEDVDRPPLVELQPWP